MLLSEVVLYCSRCTMVENIINILIIKYIINNYRNYQMELSNKEFIIVLIALSDADEITFMKRFMKNFTNKDLQLANKEGIKVIVTTNYGEYPVRIIKDIKDKFSYISLSILQRSDAAICIINGHDFTDKFLNEYDWLKPVVTFNTDCSLEKRDVSEYYLPFQNILSTLTKIDCLRIQNVRIELFNNDNLSQLRGDTLVGRQKHIADTVQIGKTFGSERVQYTAPPDGSRIKTTTKKLTNTNINNKIYIYISYTDRICLMNISIRIK